MTFQRECDATVSPRRQEESCGRSFIGDVIEVVMMFIRLSLVLLPSLLWEEKQKKAVGKWDFPRSVLFSSHVHLEEWRETIIKGGPLKKEMSVDNSPVCHFQNRPIWFLVFHLNELAAAT